ncbi:16S rRNA (guanine(527)-N(7))-methyltransferase RsmG [Desulforamulus ruminis]|uniref:Ribosomal RNA small subunit methyltransferase G n=1 Tax=Desulforamulus ruminis (strain ATCC 23193 / DSM 2154 / NCIMB 8452 / DL) TaxID=696281 RepID=F6DRF7_DESRL|nr:methyltransferase GidB [Desulforamulus ruminis DSM 2154]
MQLNHLNDLARYLKEAAPVFGFHLEETQIELFQKYYQMLLAGNEKCNLTAITQPREVAVKHFLDSLTCLLALDFPPGAKVLDVGTGAGFPGLPLKIFRPDLDVLLMDSLHKRVVFLQETITHLGLISISAIQDRAEDFGRRENSRENYDIVVSRAVAKLSVLAEYCLPCVKIGGYFISQKGPDMDDELAESAKALAILGGRLLEVKRLQLPVIGDARSMVVIEKVKSTPGVYPRKAGTPAKKPIR